MRPAGELSCDIHQTFRYRTEAFGAMSHPMSPQPTKAAAAASAALVRPASRKNTMKIAGVSLIAAAVH